MANPTEESVHDKQVELAKLRDEALRLEFQRRQHQESVTLEVTDKQLDAQLAEAKAEVERQKRLNSRAAVREAAAPIVEAAKEDADHAKAVAKAEAKEGK